MFFDAIERTLAVVTANFATDLAALVALKVTDSFLTQEQADDIQQDATIFERLDAGTFSSHLDEEGKGVRHAGIGVYAGPLTTQAKWQGRRDSRATVIVDYYAVHPDPVTLAKQSELAAEAIVMSIDKIPEAVPAGSGILGAAELKDEIRVDPLGLSRAKGADFYEDRVIVTFPILEQDSGL